MGESSVQNVGRNFRKPLGLTYRDTQRMDIVYEGPSSKFDEEKLMVENGDFAGVTAIIENDHLRPTGGNLFAGYRPLYNCEWFSLTLVQHVLLLLRNGCRYSPQSGVLYEHASH